MNMPISSCQSSFFVYFQFLLYFITGVVDEMRVTVKDF